MTAQLEYPIHQLRYPAALASSHVFRGWLLQDEYVFSTYFTAMTQGFKLDEDDSLSELIAIIHKTIPDFNFDRNASLGFAVDMEKQEQMSRIIENLHKQFSEHITTTYVYDFFFSMSLYRHLMKARTRHEAADQLATIIEAVVEHGLEQFNKTHGASAVTSLTRNVMWIAELMELNQPESQLIEIALILSYDVRFIIFRDLLFSMLKSPTIFEYFYETMVGVDMAANDRFDVTNALSNEHSKPAALGIVSYDARTKRLAPMSDFWIYAIVTPAMSIDDMTDRFVGKLEERKKTTSGAIAKLEPSDQATIDAFIKKSCRSKTPQAGMNVLLYGSHRLDKIELVRELLEARDVEGYIIKTRDTKPKDVPGICYVAQQIMKRLASSRSSSPVLVIDKAEQALTRQNHKPAWMVSMFGDGELENPDGELNSDDILVLQNPVPGIWLTASTGSITPENVGRFLFHAELKGGSRKDRRVEIDKIVKNLGFSDSLGQHLSKYHELGVEQVKSAARMTKLLKKDEEAMKRFIANSQKALGREKMEELRDSVTKYSLDLLNLTGNLPVDKIIKALQLRPTGTMCLYGPPGTGKTQLAEYIAVQLDKPLIIKPASELLSMWLGESEKNIAKMFDEAKEEGAVLLLDEADSFLRDRSMAQRSWEVTQVNELLQKMERFNGVFICATNLFSALDAAALRRFTFKLEFRPLTMDQRMQMLANETGLDLLAMDPRDHENLMMELMLIKYLTPGDFATVRRQANLLDEKLGLNDWLQRLTVESKAKLVGVSRNTYLSEDDLIPEVTTRSRND